MSEIWNREELYVEVWEKPLVKIAVKYGISAVMLGKICRKLFVPLPGRGYWAKKEFGKAGERLPLPEAKDLPTLYRSTEPTEKVLAKGPAAEPTDAEYVRIVEIESRTLRAKPEDKPHKLVTSTRRCLQNAKPDNRGLLEPRYDQPCLELRVSPSALERALVAINVIILTLESEGYPVTLQAGKHQTGAEIFAHRVNFAIVEKLRIKTRREIKEHSWTRTEIDYEPTGVLEFRAGDHITGYKVREKKNCNLTDLVSTCVGAAMREGRDCIARAESARRWEIERQEKARQRAELAPLVWEEEKKLKDFERWVDEWKRARDMREFIIALEKVWTETGHDLSPTAPKGQRIVWMKQQADRQDPMIKSPSSILDRKSELHGW